MIRKLYLVDSKISDICTYIFKPTNAFIMVTCMEMVVDVQQGHGELGFAFDLWEGRTCIRTFQMLQEKHKMKETFMIYM